MTTELPRTNRPDPSRQDMQEASPQFHALQLFDADGELKIAEWIHGLLRLGWTHAALAADRPRTISIVVAPTRSTVAVWLSLGAVLYSVRFAEHRSAWEELVQAPSGTQTNLQVRAGQDRTRWRRVGVEILSVRNDENFAEGRVISARVFSGPKQWMGATLRWSWRSWISDVLPPAGPASTMVNEFQRAADSVLTNVVGVSPGNWMFGVGRAVVVVSDRAAVNRATEGLQIGTAGLAPISLTTVVGLTGSSALIHPISSEEVPEESPVIVLDGPRALRHLVPSARGAGLVVLSHAELNPAVENVLAPWVAEHNSTLVVPPFLVPSGWQLVTSRFFTSEE